MNSMKNITRSSFVFFNFCLLYLLSYAVNLYANPFVISHEDLKELDWFGSEVCIHKDSLFVGSFMNNERKGAIYFYKIVGDNAIFKQKICPDSLKENNYFSLSITCHDNLLIASAPNYNNDKGCIFVFGYKNNQWTLTDIVESKDRQNIKSFGKSIHYSPPFLFVGSGNLQEDTGFVYVYKLLNNKFTLHQRISLAGNQKGDHFSLSIAYNNNILILGASYLQNGEGALYFYKQIKGDWIKIHELVSTNVINDNYTNFLGSSLDANESSCFVGAPGDFNFGGNLYIFDLETFSVKESILSKNSIPDDSQFGRPVCVFDDFLAVGALYYKEAGMAFLYKKINDKWELSKKIQANNPKENTHFGTSLDIYEKTLVVGAPWQNHGKGAVYVYDLNQIDSQ